MQIGLDTLGVVLLYCVALLLLCACLAVSAVSILHLDRVSISLRARCVIATFAAPWLLEFMIVPQSQEPHTLAILALNMQLWHALILITPLILHRGSEGLNVYQATITLTAIGAIAGFTKAALWILPDGEMNLDSLLLGFTAFCGFVFAMFALIHSWDRGNSHQEDKSSPIFLMLFLFSCVVFPLLFLFGFAWIQVFFIDIFIGTAKRLGWVDEKPGSDFEKS